MVYLITFGDRKYCKIGYTNDIINRIASLQTGTPYKIELLSVIEGGCDTEKDIHLIFNEFRRHGEWFEFNSIIEDYFYKRMNEDMLELSKQGVLVEYYKTIVPSGSVAKFTDLDKMVAAFMFEKYSHGDKFALSADIKQDIANYVNCSARSIDGAITKLVKQNLMRKVSRSTYVINPDFVFKGDATARVKKLKAYLELEYNDNGE
jgi:hypothetical protein